MQTRCAALAEQAQTTGQPPSPVLVDIDNFKSINDELGHDAGSCAKDPAPGILRQGSCASAVRLRGSARRIEEFVIIMPDRSLEAACQLVERLREASPQSILCRRRETALNVTASVGVAALEEMRAALDGLFLRAERLLYVARRVGRNKVIGNAV
jgi:two-component system cell cycle response regulator